MLFGWFYYDWTVLLLIPAMLLTFWAQIKVKSTFHKYSQQRTLRGQTAAEAARRLLDANGLYDVQILQVAGELNDHYDPRNKTLYLSDSVSQKSNTAAVGVACHEVGHAIQHARGYAPLQFRIRLVPICNFGSGLAMPLFLLGLFLGYAGYILMVAGILCFSLATFFQLVTLPVEFDASRRAMAGMRECGLLYDDELRGAKRVLSAAALTYVAALAASLLSLLRLVIIANSGRRN